MASLETLTPLMKIRARLLAVIRYILINPRRALGKNGKGSALLKAKLFAKGLRRAGNSGKKPVKWLRQNLL